MKTSINIANIIAESEGRAKAQSITCGLCGKDLTEAARIMGRDGDIRTQVLSIHKQAHLEEIRQARRDYCRAKDLVFNLEYALAQAVDGPFNSNGGSTSASWYRKELEKGGLKGRLVARKYDDEVR